MLQLFFLCEYVHGRIIRFKISCQKMPRKMLLKCQEDSIVYVNVDDCCHCKMSKLAAPHHLQQLLPVEKYSASLKGQKSTRKEVGGILYWKDLAVSFDGIPIKMSSQPIKVWQILWADFKCLPLDSRREKVILLQEGTELNCSERGIEIGYLYRQSYSLLFNIIPYTVLKKCDSVALSV